MTYHEILDTPCKTLLELRDARLRRLDKEQQQQKELEKGIATSNIRNNILKQ